MNRSITETTEIQNEEIQSYTAQGVKLNVNDKKRDVYIQTAMCHFLGSTDQEFAEVLSALFYYGPDQDVVELI